jgi:hypothetical protein
MKLTSVLFSALLLIISGAEAADPTPGKVTGGSVYAMPQWFKSSFLDFQDSGGPTDSFDFTFNLTGDLLAGLYPTGTVGVSLFSEGSDFVNDFSVNFGGGAKGQIGSVVGENCQGKLQQFSLVWEGPGPISIDAVDMGTVSGTGPVNVGDSVTFFGPYSINDVVVNVSGAVNGQSTFHVSCSDVDFNSDDDCGKLNGNGKNNDSSFLNLWRLEGFIDGNGDVLNCNPDGMCFPIKIKSGGVAVICL